MRAAPVPASENKYGTGVPAWLTRSSQLKRKQNSRKRLRTMTTNDLPSTNMPASAHPSGKRGYNLFLLLVAGLGGLLYGIDVGIIGGALPYLEATSRLTVSKLSVFGAAVLLGSVFSTLFAGMLADWMGRKPLMILSGSLFFLSIPGVSLFQESEFLFL